MKKFLPAKRIQLFFSAIILSCISLSARQYCQEPISPQSFNGKTIKYTCQALGGNKYEIKFESDAPFRIINANNFYANPGGMHLGGLVTPLNTYTQSAGITFTSSAAPTVYASNVYFNFQGGDNISYDFPKDISWVACTPVEPADDVIKPVMTSASVAIRGITSNTVKLQLEATDNVGVSSYIINDVSNNIINKAVTVNSTNNAIIDGLNPLTTYSLTVKAMDAAGNVSDNEITIPAFTTLGVSITDCTGTQRQMLADNGELAYSYRFFTNENNTVTVTFEIIEAKLITGLSNSVAVRVNNMEAGLMPVRAKIATGTFGPYEKHEPVDIAFSIAYAAGGLVVTQAHSYTVGNNCGQESATDPVETALCTGTSNEVTDESAGFEYEYAFSTNANNTINVSFEILDLKSITGLGNMGVITINDTEIKTVPIVNNVASVTVGPYETGSNNKIVFSIAYANGGISETKAAFYMAGSTHTDACMPPGTNTDFQQVLETGCSGTSSDVLFGNAPFTYAYKFSTNQDNTVNVLYQVLDKKDIKYFSYKGAVFVNGTEVGLTRLGTNNLMGTTFGPYEKGAALQIALAASYYAGGITTTQPIAYVVGSDCDVDFSIPPHNVENELCHGTKTAVLQNNEEFEYFYKFSTNKDNTVNITYQILDAKNIVALGAGAYIRINNSENPIEIPVTNNTVYTLSGPYQTNETIQISLIIPYRNGGISETQPVTYTVGSDCVNP